MKGVSRNITLVLFSILMAGCNGMMDGLYDEEDNTLSANSIFIDASSWKDWYYIDFHALHDSIAKGAERNMNFEAYPIPTTLTAEWDGESKMCDYWYDVFGEGLSNHRLVGERNIDRQVEPEHWDIALHRNNVRTNNAGVYMTRAQSLADIGAAADYEYANFTPDEWNETDVWADQSKMLSGQIGNQRIKVNNVLSQWLQVLIPPVPPTFVHNPNVFILKFSDGTYAAVRLKDYRYHGTNCCMTIEYTYPLE